MYKKGLNAVEIAQLKKMRAAEVPEKEIAKRLGVDPVLLKTNFTAAKVKAADEAALKSRRASRAMFMQRVQASLAQAQADAGVGPAPAVPAGAGGSAPTK